MKLSLITAFIISTFISYAQISSTKGLFAKEFSKEITLPLAKEFLVTEILKPAANELLEFEIDALTAATSGELTSVFYNCSTKNTSGLIFAFYGNNITEGGVSYKSYSFKHFTKANGIELLKKIDDLIATNSTLKSENGNITFIYEDVTVIIYGSLVYKIDIIWNGFNAQWEQASLRTTLRKLEKK